jgi:hypothetical protein
MYEPKNIDYDEVFKRAGLIQKKIKAKKIIDIRIARRGCFIARFYMKTIIVNGIEVDVMNEVKLHDNLKEK